MPVLFLETLPLPTLKTYSNISLALFLSTVFYAYQSTINQSKNVPKTGNVRPLSSVDEGLGASGNESHNVIIDDQLFDNQELSLVEITVGIIDVLTEETWCVWVLVNTAYCLLILIGKLIQHLIFGELRVAEAQHLKDRFWNFVFYKFIFIFGVLNVQHLGEVLTWGAWFSILGFLHHLSQLSKDRFEYLSFSPTTPKLTHIQVLSLLVSIFLISCGLMGICIQVGLYHDLNTFGFMGAECAILLLKTMYVIARYSIHLWDINQEGTWERRGTFVYYAELLFEMTALCFDFIHHLHMLIWSNIFLSMASLVICMQLRFLFHEIQRRFRRHKNYLLVVARMEARYPMASKDELEKHALEGGDDSCAICWDKMETARRLPCGHYFHNSCLRSWLEQDISCPTCRTSLQESSRNVDLAMNGAGVAPALDGGVGGGGVGGGEDAANGRQMAPAPQRNHFFHFDGSRYVSWLPSFSVEVTHSLGIGGADPPPIPTSQVESMAREVQNIFPHMPLDVIVTDLQMTRSSDLTIENILEGRLLPPSRRPTPVPEQITSPANSLSLSASNNDGPLPHEDDPLSSQVDFLDSFEIVDDSSPDVSSAPDAVEDVYQVGLQLRHRQPASPTNFDPATSHSPTDFKSTSQSTSSSVPSQSSFPSSSSPLVSEASSPLLPSLRGSTSNPELGASSASADCLTTSLSESTAISAVASGANIEAIAGRFSKSSVERESILHGRKALLMHQAKKRFLARRLDEVALIAPPVEEEEENAEGSKEK